MAEENILNKFALDLDRDGIEENYILQDERVDGNLINYTYNNGKLSINGGLAYTKSSANNYSTEEKVIGTWVDGKPLYEKSFISMVSSYPNDTWVVVGNIENANELIDWKVSGDLELSNLMSPGSLQIIGTDLRFVQKRGNTINCSNIKFTIQYTKTTDTTTIPVAEVLHNYSTQEKIVGTWIDGKILYEKSYYIENPQKTQQYEFISLEILTNISNVVKIDGTVKQVYGGIVVYPTGFKGSQYEFLIRVLSSNNDNNYSVEYNAFFGSDEIKDLNVTIQYTKN